MQLKKEKKRVWATKNGLGKLPKINVETECFSSPFQMLTVIWTC